MYKNSHFDGVFSKKINILVKNEKKNHPFTLCQKIGVLTGKNVKLFSLKKYPFTNCKNNRLLTGLYLQNLFVKFLSFHLMYKKGYFDGV